MIHNKKYLYIGVLGVVALSLFVGNISPLFLLLLACPIMMVFMMRGMDHGKDGHSMDHSKNHDMEDKSK
ncbi:MAG: DUF2933 domain-containing protein [Actinobacteria bacterium]|nr:DUF2933 domain-containing protein [Actinomycetota bacterium]